MKKLSKLAAILAALVLACAFIGCANGNSSDDSNSNSGGSSTTAFADCTTTAEEVTLADGNWTVKVVNEAEGISQEYNIKASVSNGSFTLTSGTATETEDLSVVMTEDELAEFKNLSEDEKKSALADMVPEGATVTINGTKVTISATLEEDTLTAMQSSMDLSEIPEGATIKTNSDKTKYIISLTNGDGTETIYISKDAE